MRGGLGAGVLRVSDYRHFGVRGVAGRWRAGGPAGPHARRRGRGHGRRQACGDACPGHRRKKTLGGVKGVRYDSGVQARVNAGIHTCRLAGIRDGPVAADAGVPAL